MPIYTSTYVKPGIPVLNVGDIIKLDDFYYKIVSVEDLRYTYTTSSINAGGTLTVDLTDLQPSNNELYFLEQLLNLTSNSGVEFQYPRGTVKGTPHGLSAPITSSLTPVSTNIVQPYILSLWIKPGLPPTLYAVNTSASAQTVTVWVFGWKFKVELVKEDEASRARMMGKTVHEARSTY